jgi:hypothetical protein
MKRRAFLTSLATAVAAVVVAPACATPAQGVPVVLDEPSDTPEQPVRRQRVLSPQDEEDMRWRASVLAASCVFFPVL